MPGVRERLPDRGSESAGQHPLLDGDQQVVLGGELRRQARVDRLGEARVGDGDGDARARPESRPPRSTWPRRSRSPAAPRGCRTPWPRPRAGSPRCRSRSAPAAWAAGRPGPRRGDSAARPGRRRRPERCAACGRALPHRAAPSARCWADSGDRRCRTRRGGWGRRRRPGRRDPWRTRRSASAGRRRGRSGRRRAGGRSSRSRRPAYSPAARGPRRTARPAARRSPRRSSGRAARAGGCSARCRNSSRR